jgi:hypothetical protein
MDFVKALQIAAIMVTPTVVVGMVLHAPRVVRAVSNAIRERTEDSTMAPKAPPIEQLAADLRRLLLRHEQLKRTPGEAMRVRRLVALEAAIADCAIDAARALDLPYHPRPARGLLPVAQLRRLLKDLMTAGLVLPSGVDLLTEGSTSA